MTDAPSPPRTTRAPGWIAIATTAVAAFEGLYLYAYKDPVGIPTICFGMTNSDRPVHMGDHYTKSQCEEFLSEDLVKYNDKVMQCVHVPVGDKRHAAIVSFAYNVGVSAFCKSTFAKRLNAGDLNACDELLKWTKAAGIEFPGLVKRRKEERALCRDNA